MSGLGEHLGLASFLEALDASLLDGGVAVEEDAEFEITQDDGLDSELQSVTRRIYGQYAEALARYATRAFSGREKTEAAAARAAVTNLSRLAEASEDTDQVTLLGELLDLIQLLERQPGRRERDSALVQLRDWIPRFAGTLGTEDAERLRSLVEWEDGELPLLEELKNIRGIGPKRLERLYTAGLASVEMVANADPAEVAAVSGLPASLAEEVVAASRRFAEDERRRCLDDLRDRSRRLERILTTLPGRDGEHQQVVLSTLRELRNTLADLLESPT